MKRKRLVLYIIVLILMICLIGVGVASFIIQNQYTNNNVEFELGSAQAYCTISGKYYINGVEDENYAYYDSYEYGSEYEKNGFDGFDTWNIGESKFEAIGDDSVANTIKFEISIVNLNPTESITASLHDVAVGEIFENNTVHRYFNTKITYQFGAGSIETKFNNREGEQVNYESYITNSKTISVPAQEIAIANQLKITIEFERIEKVEAFSFHNHFLIKLNAASENN